MEIEDGEIPSSDEGTTGEITEDERIFSPNRKKDQLQNKRMLLSNEERINRLYNLFADDDDDCQTKRQHNNTSIRNDNSVQGSLRKVERNRNFKNAISDVMTPSHQTARVVIKNEGCKFAKTGEHETDSNRSSLDGMLKEARSKCSRSPEIVTLTNSAENTQPKLAREHPTTLNSNSSSCMYTGLEPCKALTRVDTDHSSVLSKEACFARTVADTMVKEKNQCERWNVRSTAGEEEDTAMELDSAEEDNDEGGVPILFESNDADQCENRKCVNKDTDIANRHGEQMRMPSQPVAFLPGAPILAPPQPPPPPTFPFWPMPLPMYQTSFGNASIARSSAPLPPLPPPPLPKIQPPLPKMPLPLDGGNNANLGSSNRGSHALAVSNRLEKGPSANVLAPGKVQSNFERRDVDYRKNLVPTKKDVDLRIFPRPNVKVMGPSGTEMRPPNTLSEPPFRKPLIKIASLASRSTCITGKVTQAQNDPPQGELKSSNLTTIGPDDVENHAARPNKLEIDLLQMEDENFQLWQEAVNSIAKRKNKRSYKIEPSVESQRVKSDNKIVSRNVKKASSPPLIVPIDDEIKVVEISASSPSQGSSTETDRLIVAEEISMDGDNEEGDELSSSDEEIELLELRREAMKTMVEKSSSSSSVTGAQSETSEVANNTCDEEEKSEMMPTVEKAAVRIAETEATGSKTLPDSVDPKVLLNVDNPLLNTIPVSEDEDRNETLDPTIGEEQTSANNKAVNFCITVKDAKRTVKSSSAESAIKNTVKKPEDDDDNQKSSVEKTKVILLAKKESAKAEAPQQQTEAKIQATTSSLNKSSTVGSDTVDKTENIAKSSITKMLSSDVTEEEGTLSKNPLQAQVINTNKIVSPKKIISGGPNSTLQMVTRTSLVRHKTTPASNLKGTTSDKTKPIVLTVNGNVTKQNISMSSFRKINVQTSCLSTPHKEASSPKLSIKKSISPIGVTPFLRRRTRTLSINSGKIQKPLAKISFARSLQSAALKMQVLPTNKLRRTMLYSTRATNQGRTQNRRSRKNPFSKVNANVVNLECQAPKHPPVVFTINTKTHESSDEETDAKFLVNLNYLSSVGPGNGLAVTGKHMTSMLSWKPPAEATAALKASSLKTRPIRSTKNPFARRKLDNTSVSYKEDDADPFSSFPAVQLSVEVEEKGHGACVSDSELSNPTSNKKETQLKPIERSQSSEQLSPPINKEMCESTENFAFKDSETLNVTTKNLFEIFEDGGSSPESLTVSAEKSNPKMEAAMCETASCAQITKSSVPLTSGEESYEINSNCSEKLQSATEEVEVVKLTDGSTVQKAETQDKEPQIEERELEALLREARQEASHKGSNILNSDSRNETAMSSSVLENCGNGSQSSDYHEDADSSDSLDEAIGAMQSLTDDIKARDPKASEKPSSSGSETTQSKFSNNVIQQFRKQLLFVKKTREENDASLLLTKKQLRRTQTKLIDAGQLAADLKIQLQTVHKTIDQLRKSAGDSERKLLELQQKDKAMKAFEKQLLQKMTIVELNRPKQDHFSVTPRKVPPAKAVTNQLVVTQKALAVTNEENIGTHDTAPVKLRARKTIAKNSARKRSMSPRSSAKQNATEKAKKKKIEKTSELVASKARAQMTLAAELLATNQKLEQMRSAVIASGQAVPARWRTDKPKWHSLTKVSKPIISRGYIPANRQPSKYDLKMNNLSISSFNFVKKSTESFATDLIKGTDKASESALTNVLSGINMGQSNLRYGSNSAISTQSKFGKLMSTNKSTAKLKSSNPALFLATMKDKLEQYKNSGLQVESFLVPPESKIGRVSIKHNDCRHRAMEKTINQDWNIIKSKSSSLKVIGSQCKTGTFSLECAYESPLAVFKSYRFCPNFLFSYRGEEGSSTWSHAIEPFIPFCPFDLHGQCSDKMCPRQHKQDYSLTRIQLACDILAYLHISPENSLFTEQNLQRQELNKKEQFADLQNKLEATAQQVTRNELNNLNRSQIVKEMVSFVKRARVSSLKTGEPVPTHHIMPGSRTWRPLNKRKRLHDVEAIDEINSESASSVNKDCFKDASNDVQGAKRSKLVEQKVSSALVQSSKFAEASGPFIESENVKCFSTGRYFQTNSKLNAKQLKELIDTDSSNVNAWIELSNWTEQNPRLTSVEDIEKAKLCVLARALEVNRTSKILWQYYVKLFAESPFNSVDSIVHLCHEALKYIYSDFILFLMFELEDRPSEKYAAIEKLVQSSLKAEDSTGFIQRLLLALQFKIAMSCEDQEDAKEVIPQLTKWLILDSSAGNSELSLQSSVSDVSFNISSCSSQFGNLFFLSPLEFTFLWTVLIDAHDSGYLAYCSNSHVIEDFPNWVQNTTEFKPLQIQWRTKTSCELSVILELFKTAMENIKLFCSILDVPNVEAMFYIRQNLARLLHFHKENKQANDLLLQSVQSSLTCLLETSPAKVAHMFSAYATLTMQFACNFNGIKPTLNPPIERFNKLQEKPSMLVNCYANCACISQNKNWSHVTEYFVESCLLFYFAKKPSDFASAFQTLLYDNEELLKSALPGGSELVQSQLVKHCERCYLLVLYCLYLEVNKNYAMVCDIYERTIPTLYMHCREENIFTWTSYLSFMLRMVASKQSIGPCKLLGPMSSVTDVFNAVLPLLKRAIYHCFSATSSDSNSVSSIERDSASFHNCQTVNEDLERLCKVVLPHLVLESRIAVTEMLLQTFPSNLYLLKTLASSKNYWRIMQVKLTEAIRLNPKCLHIQQLAISISLLLDDLEEAARIIHNAKELFPYVKRFWCQELAVSCCAKESTQGFQKLAQRAEEWGHKLVEFNNE